MVFIKFIEDCGGLIENLIQFSNACLKLMHVNVQGACSK